MPRVSIVLPVFNADHYLVECLNSVIGQTFDDWELIAVDDGSADSSGVVLDEFAAKDLRIRVFHKKNGGAWAARNDALGKVRGEWVTFIDADDVYAPCWLATAMEVADLKNPHAILQEYICGSKVPQDFFQAVRSSGLNTYEGVEARKWYWQIMSRCGFLWLWFIRRDVIGTVKFRPTINCKEDIIWLLEIATGIRRVCENKYRGYLYRSTEGSLSKKKRSVDQCRKFLVALGDIWRQEFKLEEPFRIIDVVANQIRNCADHDVIEWFEIHNNTDDHMGHRIIRREYLALERVGALHGKWQERLRYRFAFWLWKRTGLMFPMKTCVTFFSIIRSILAVFRKPKALQ